MTTCWAEAIFDAEWERWAAAGLDPDTAQHAAAHGATALAALTNHDIPQWLEQLAKSAVDGQWAALVPPTAALMIADNDPRAALDKATGRNRYGAAVLPVAGSAAFFACSGNEVGETGLAAADELRQRLMQAAIQGNLATEQAIVTKEKQKALAALMGLNPGPQDGLVLTLSGTAALAAAAKHWCQGDGQWLYLVVGPEESGREVVKAVQVGPQVRVQGIPLRDSVGLAARPVDDIAAEIAQLVQQAQEAGQSVVLQVVEGSKTGLVAPGIDHVRALMARFPALKVVVDCCQMRMGTPLALYGEMGVALVATGSKFLGGPSFSGMAYLPGGIPQDVAPVGILLRWQAALAEGCGLSQLTPQECVGGLQAFAMVVTNFCQRYDGLDVLPCVGLGNVMTFKVLDHLGHCWPVERLRVLVQWLERDVLPGDARPARRCLVGQPLSLGDDQAALRLAINAPRLVQLVKNPKGFSQLNSDLDDLFAKLDCLRLVLGDGVQ